MRSPTTRSWSPLARSSAATVDWTANMPPSTRASRRRGQRIGTTLAARQTSRLAWRMRRGAWARWTSWRARWGIWGSLSRLSEEGGIKHLWLVYSIRDISGWGSILLNHHSEASGYGDWDGDWNGPDGVG